MHVLIASINNFMFNYIVIVFTPWTLNEAIIALANKKKSPNYNSQIQIKFRIKNEDKPEQQ